MARAAPHVGLELAVVSLMSLGAGGYASELRRLGVPVESLGLRTRWDARALRAIVPMVRALGPDLVHTHLKHADLVGAVAARRLGLPLVSTLHLIESRPGAVGRAKRRLAAAARDHLASRVVTVSESQRDWYLTTFSVDPARVVTVHNGVWAPPPAPHDTRDRVRGHLGIDPGATLATMVAVMRPGKGHEQAILAAGRVPREVGITFLLVGDGPRRAQLEALALRDGRGSPVVFAGFRDDVDDILAASDLIVHPTLADALPTALIRGLATGLPAVASRVGGVPDIVTEDVGVLVEPGDVGGLTSALLALGCDPELRRTMGQAARRRFEAEFDAVHWAERLHALYRSATAEVRNG